jgi:uncharacterized repeat protein (TIGR03803 family)
LPTSAIGGGAGINVTVFKITPGGVESVLWSFGVAAGDGGNPYAGLIQGADGNFYGTTYEAGANLDGTIFKITPAGLETVLYSFAGGSDGRRPFGALVQGTDGHFYGTTQFGGANNVGTVFKY